MLEFQRATIDDIDEFMRAKIEAFSDDVRQYGFGPTGYDDYEKRKQIFKTTQHIRFYSMENNRWNYLL